MSTDVEVKRIVLHLNGLLSVLVREENNQHQLQALSSRAHPEKHALVWVPVVVVGDLISFSLCSPLEHAARPEEEGEEDCRGEPQPWGVQSHWQTLQEEGARERERQGHVLVQAHCAQGQ